MVSSLRTFCPAEGVFLPENERFLPVFDTKKMDVFVERPGDALLFDT